jgi:hypothetical protein
LLDGFALGIETPHRFAEKTLEVARDELPGEDFFEFQGNRSFQPSAPVVKPINECKIDLGMNPGQAKAEGLAISRLHVRGGSLQLSNKRVGPGIEELLGSFFVELLCVGVDGHLSRQSRSCLVLPEPRIPR